MKKDQSKSWLSWEPLEKLWAGVGGGVFWHALSVCVMVVWWWLISKEHHLKLSLPLQEGLYIQFSKCGPWTSSISKTCELCRNILDGQSQEPGGGSSRWSWYTLKVENHWPVSNQGRWGTTKWVGWDECQSISLKQTKSLWVVLYTSVVLGVSLESSDQIRSDQSLSHVRLWVWILVFPWPFFFSFYLKSCQVLNFLKFIF